MPPPPGGVRWTGVGLAGQAGPDGPGRIGPMRESERSARLGRGGPALRRRRCACVHVRAYVCTCAGKHLRGERAGPPVRCPEGRGMDSEGGWGKAYSMWTGDD